MCTQGVSVARATIDGVNVPDHFRIGGQLNCEVWALTRYLCTRS